ncbi:MAG: GatB/Yqey domain-containing protein [Methylocystaceae bacterium]|nr:MAG: GatB/Yqey domain-containing protein [Methylocystaceae bacterium]
MREKIAADLKTAMKAGERAKVDALRLINAALKDKDIEARGAGKTLSGDDELALLQKMIKSRQESLEIYEKAGREDLAGKERGEIAVISVYLPQQLSEAEAAEAVKARSRTWARSSPRSRRNIRGGWISAKPALR